MVDCAAIAHCKLLALPLFMLSHSLSMATAVTGCVAHGMVLAFSLLMLFHLLFMATAVTDLPTAALSWLRSAEGQEPVWCGVQVVMDFHAHLNMNEVIGLLAGECDEDRRLIRQAIFCPHLHMPN